MASKSIKQHLILLVLTIIIEQNGVRSDTSLSEEKSQGALGQGFFIPKLDLLTDELHAEGAQIFETISPECTITNDVGRTKKDDTYYSNTESLYRSVSTNSKIGASLRGSYTLGGSLAAVTNNIVSDNTEVSGVSLDLKAYSKDHTLKKDCINRQPLDKELLEDFERLERKIEKPWLKESWRRYKVFLEKHGSHVVQKVFSGSSINQYVFAKSSKKYTERDFTVIACVSLGGMTNAGNLSASACSGVTKEEASKASSTSMVKKLVIRGGTPNTRAQLNNERNKEIIAKFLQEGTSDSTPIEYTFVPIWNILKTRFIGEKSMAKALNLEQFYKGFLHFGCHFKKTSNNKELQKFQLTEDSDPEAPTYHCMLGPTGCRVDDDCHYSYFSCKCAGESCVRYKDVKLNSGSSKKEAYAQRSKTSDWKGQGCETVFFECKCKEPRSNWEESWSGEDEDGLRDVHSKLAMDRENGGVLKKDKCDRKQKLKA